MKAGLALAHARAGDAAEARRFLDELEEMGRTRFVPSSLLAWGYAALGETDTALDLFDRALEQRESHLTLLAVEPALDGLRPDPRFQELLTRVGLEPRSP